MVDFFSNVPNIVIDKIIEKLSIPMAAQTSVLSKQWGHAWLSLKSLVFDRDFWKKTIKDEIYDFRKGSHIISDILLHHNGPVHDLDLFVPCTREEDHVNHSQWIYFLSKNGVRKIVITSSVFAKRNITSYIFRCSKLVHLQLRNFNLNPPPSDFIGFPYLKHLVLEEVKFIKQSIFSSLIENCGMLETLKLGDWVGMDHVVIDAPSLQTLILSGNFESLAFRNVRSLKSISLCLMPMPKNFILVETIDAVNLLASSCQLQSIKFDGHLCKFFAAGDIIRSSPVTFNHLDELCLSNLNLSDFGYLFSMIKCCPYIKKLVISVTLGESGCQHTHDYDYNFKLRHLLEVNIKGILGSSAELQLVEYLFAISPVLENLFFNSAKLDIESELKMSRELMRFPRASTKAKLVCLEK